MDETTQAHIIPEGVERPTPIMFWEPLEFTVGLMFAGFGIVTNMWVIGVGLGGAVLALAPRMRRGYRRGAVQHMLWAKGLNLDPHLKARFKPSWLNDFIE